MMLKSYLVVALRGLRRRKAYTVINVAGLAVGMSVCLLVGLYAKDELSFDRFHANAERIAVLSAEFGPFGVMTTTPYPMGPALEAGLPEVERAVRLVDDHTPVLREATQLRSDRMVLLADPAFFDVFTFPLAAGDTAALRAAPDAAVVTASFARDYFGAEDPIGQTLQFRRHDSTYTVTVRAVARDVPAQSTIRFDLVAPIQLLPERQRRADGWGAFMFTTYVLLREGTDVGAFEDRLIETARGHYDREPPLFSATPLPSVYLSDFDGGQGFSGQARYLYLFGTIALVVLLLAAINYVNLVTAQAARRAREVGVRKALGASRLQLVRQFLAESVLLSGAALVVALMLTELALPAFNALFGKHLGLDPAAHGAALAGLSAFVLLVGIGSGAYPAFVLSRFQPVRVLRGADGGGARGGRWLRRGLVVVQFAASITLITGTAAIFRQLDFMQTRDLGFEGEQVVTIPLPGQQAWKMREAVREAALAHPGVQRASVANAVPDRFGIRMGHTPAEWSSQARVEGEETIMMAPGVVDEAYVATLGLRLVAGRDFSPDLPSDRARAFLINETAATRLGWTAEEAVGKPFTIDRDEPPGEVIGVVEDFHIASLRAPIEPVALQLRPSDSWSAPGVLVAKLVPGQTREAMAHLERLVARYAPGEPFTYRFLDDTFDEMYRHEEQLSRIFSSFALLAVFVACLGLFGLAAYAAEVRTKEIGIRKVLGASVAGLVGLLSREFVVLVGVAFVLAAPVAYLGMRAWLADFAYRIDPGPGLFVLAGALALAVALATVSYQAIKAALADPVKALRYE